MKIFNLLAGATALASLAMPAHGQTIIYRGTSHTVAAQPEITPPPPIEEEKATISIDAREKPFLATTGTPWSFDFSSLAKVAGADVLDLKWTFSGNPSWSAPIEGSSVLAGTPGVEEEVTFLASAFHGDVEAQQTFTIVVEGKVVRATQISIGDYHSCAVTDLGGAVCWGNTGSGQAGNGTTSGTNRTAVVVHNLPSGVKMVAAGGSHSCALKTDGSVSCWGSNTYGQLGLDHKNNRYRPEAVKNLTNVVSISAGYDHTCAVRDDGRVWCWGRNEQRQLGDGSSTDSSIPKIVNVNTDLVSEVSAGHLRTCALWRSGRVRCWGEKQTNNNLHAGQINSNATSLSMGRSEGCATFVNGTGRCWQGGDYADVTLPNEIANMAAGAGNKCAVSKSGAAWCWGRNDFGQLGNGAAENSSIPVLVKGLEEGVSSIAMSAVGDFACAIMEDGRIKCWGRNLGGSLGSGASANSSLPLFVRPAS